MLARRFVTLTLSMAAILGGASNASAQNYPARPIRIITSEAGSGFDFQARALAQILPDSLGQQLIIENVSSGLIADNVAKANPDGYTLAFAGGVLWLTPLIQKTTYDPVKDFIPITLVGRYPYLLVVHPSVPAKSVKELIDLAKSKPGVLNIGATASPGGASFLSAELFKSMAGVNMVRVPYKGNPSALVAVLANESQMMFNDVGVVMPLVKSGKLRALAVTSLEPSPLAPGMPTMTASGLPGYESISFGGIFAPAGTLGATVSRLNQELVKALGRPDIKDKFFSNGIEAVGDSPAEFAAIVKSDTAKWAKVLKDAGVKFDL